MDGPFLTKVRDGIISYIHDKKLNHPIIIGHSLGGMMAFWLAETAPDDLGPVVAVDGVPFYAALMDPAATPTSVTPAAERLRVAYAAMPTDQYVTANHKFLSSMITTPANVDMVASLGDKSNPKAVGQAFYDLFTTDLRPDLKNIKVPVLLIGASQAMADDAMKERVRTAYAAQIDTIPHHKLVFAPTARHFVQLDNPDFFYTEVETFLKENQK
jgi:pimeloyl-ACP methyl ester carboxylesterase